MGAPAPQDVPGLSAPALLPQVPLWGQARKAEGWPCTGHSSGCMCARYGVWAGCGGYGAHMYCVCVYGGPWSVCVCAYKPCCDHTGKGDTPSPLLRAALEQWDLGAGSSALRRETSWGQNRGQAAIPRGPCLRPSWLALRVTRLGPARRASSPHSPLPAQDPGPAGPVRERGTARMFPLI